ncbi:MAG TPA: hypothetical protein VFP11_09490 [Candidatus Angelobacter sp.]|nr:hypothetical protein [Candidatus Angelobacter sp.]
MTRVAAFAAIAALLLQVSCMPDLPAISVQNAAQSDSGCHESAPPTPNAPNSSHICCSGDHSPDALLSATVAPVLLISDVGRSHLTSPLPSLAIASIDFPDSFSPPHGLLPLRI